MPSIPKPFKRPGITISDGTPPRTWDFTYVPELRPGDTVTDFGTIESVEYHEHSGTVTLTNVLGEERTLTGHSQVYAFSHRG